jgi:hypothetical protein
MFVTRLQMMGRRSVRFVLVAVFATLWAQLPYAQILTSRVVAGQIGTLLQEKEARTSDQQKLGSQLWYALQSSRGQAAPGLSEVYASAVDAVKPDAYGLTRVEITAPVSRSLLRRIAGLGGSVKYASTQNQSILAAVPLSSLEALAADPTVRRIAPAARVKTNVGALTSQGYISHKANQVVASGPNGTGVKVGVLSDSVDALATLIATGDLPAGTTVVPGQDGNPGSSEGTAMMEIIHDLAPGAQLFFATAFNGSDSFADNIRTLRFVYGCDIIVDDVSYSDEGVFQDSVIARAVNDVTADGALYFSSAGNGGNVTNGTSSTWEGDFTPGPASGAPLPAGYTLHLFNGVQAFNRLTAAAGVVDLQWSDPLGGSGNDYDMFILSSNGATVLCAATDTQAGAGYPLEECYRTQGYPVNSRILVAKKTGAAIRALHLDAFFGDSGWTFTTSGGTYGHNAGLNTVSTAATYWNSAHTGTKPFVGGAANPTEVFSSDGPRKIFYTPNGTEITPGNVLFGTNGGTTLAKPDVAAADGVSTKTPGFLPFFGTSAAAPHAAAIAALVKSAKPSYTNAQILTAMKQTALDIRAAGTDRDSGSGIVMALEAVNYALTH